MDVDINNMQSTAVSRAIEDAIKGGYALGLKDKKWILDGYMLKYEIDVLGYLPFSHAKDWKRLCRVELIFLDKAFWVALGKARGWSKGLKGYSREMPWRINWRNMIEALIKDQTPEQFFLSLEGNEV